jgi:molybdopterin-dependent oxidoreductase alpha subunit
VTDRPPSSKKRAAPKEGAAAGLPAVLSSLRVTSRESGLVRGTRSLLKVNQPEGFDCPGCAWPDPQDRHVAEFCENGAKAVAWESTTKRVTTDELFRRSIRELDTLSDFELEGLGRLTEPVVKEPGDDHYRPISWDDAFVRIANEMRALASPDEACFYTSGRTSNEAAFLYQLLARRFGTNNLPDCSNMCHESSGVGLTAQIGIGKGTVSLEDFDAAELILVVGQNPGTNHPRMLTTLQQAKRRGARVVSINPLRERALVSFANPQEAMGLLGVGTAIADLHLQVRIGGDIALLLAVAHRLFAHDDAQGGGIIDRAFIAEHTLGFAEYERAVRAHDRQALDDETGVDPAQIDQLAAWYAESSSTIACWAMGLTQHRFGVDNISELTNLLLMKGNIGKPGAGPCPVRGHSNVQGDRTMGIHERPAPAFLEALEREFAFTPPLHHGHDVVATIEELEKGAVKVFVAMGGNFVAAAPDTARTRRAMANARLTVHVATKLNRTHLTPGHTSIVLPCLGRTEIDVQSGAPQFVTVENSMSIVHRSVGHLTPASPSLKSEPAIVVGIARALFGDDDTVPWARFLESYDHIRDRIARVVPGFTDMNTRVADEHGFTLPRPPRERVFSTPSGKAHFVVVAPPRLALPEGALLLMTIRSHDQYNTTVYGLDDRYRGIKQARDVILMNADDIQANGLEVDALVDVRSHFEGETREVSRVRVVAFDIPRRQAAMYFPEANPLVHLGSFADRSRTPASKSVVITVSRSMAEARA